jgi:phage terminase large subunit GpA-like protein
MSGGGKDQKRAGFTARVLVVTEVDGLDVSSEGSREADKLKQLEGRTRAYGSRKRIYLECTASIPTGRIWTEYLGGTETKIVVPCPGCGAWTTPEREHLALWQQADEIAARDEARWICPGCGILWDDSARKQANLQAKTIHRGQMILPDGSIVGDHPRTPTLGFRWNAFNNLLIATADIAADEWRAAKAIDEENATKEMRQFVWAQPYASTDAPQAAIAVELIMRRQSAYQRGQLPPATEMVSVGIDCGKYLCHWAVVAWTTDARGHLIDYGRQEVPSSSMAVGPALRLALRELRDQLTQGWVDPETNTPRPPDIVCVDAGWEPEHIYEHCNDSTAEWWPTKGLGLGQQDQVRYAQPKNTGAVVKEVGDGWHISKLTGGIRLLEFDADHWKSRVHSGLECHVESSGSLVLFQADERDHLSLAKHLTAEERVETFAKGRGSQIAWVRKNRNNHWFDALALAVMGADFQGLEWTPATATPEPKS